MSKKGNMALRISSFVRMGGRAMQVRHASSGETPLYSARWSRIMRSESNIETMEDPPRAPLPECHEAGEGVSDFSNWVDKHEDVSLNQALIGLALVSSFVYGIHRLSQRDRRTKTPAFTLRELPTVYDDIPTITSDYESKR